MLPRSSYFQNLLPRIVEFCENHDTLKSPQPPFYKGGCPLNRVGADSSLWQREDRRDLLGRCQQVMNYAIINNCIFWIYFKLAKRFLALSAAGLSGCLAMISSKVFLAPALSPKSAWLLAMLSIASGTLGLLG